MIFTIAISAGLGAVIRYLLGSLNREFPWGTLLANNLAAISVPLIQSLGLDYSTALLIGFAGSLSTVSSFALEMTELNKLIRLRYALLTFVTCLASFELATLWF